GAVVGATVGLAAGAAVAAAAGALVAAGAVVGVGAAGGAAGAAGWHAARPMVLTAATDCKRNSRRRMEDICRVLPSFSTNWQLATPAPIRTTEFDRERRVRKTPHPGEAPAYAVGAGYPPSRRNTCRRRLERG